mgnify:CR=1 FL=1
MVRLCRDVPDASGASASATGLEDEHFSRLNLLALAGCFIGFEVGWKRFLELKRNAAPHVFSRSLQINIRRTHYYRCSATATGNLPTQCRGIITRNGIHFPITYNEKGVGYEHTHHCSK